MIWLLRQVWGLVQMLRDVRRAFVEIGDPYDWEDEWPDDPLATPDERPVDWGC